MMLKLCYVLFKTKEAEVEEDESPSSGPREMITPLLRQSLEKQGYRLIGSHSGVKLCRWTKVGASHHIQHAVLTSYPPVLSYGFF